MTDEMLELRLRRWYETDSAGGDAPADLRSSVLAIPEAVVRPAPFGGGRFVLLAAAAFLAIALIGGALVVGSALLRLNLQGPVPTATNLLSPPPSSAPTATASVEPTEQPTLAAIGPSPEPTTPPLIVAYHGVGSAAEILTINPINGDQNLIGTVGVDSVQLRSSVYGDIQWSSDRHLVIVSRVTDGVQIQARAGAGEPDDHLGLGAPESYISPAGDRSLR